MGIKFGALTDTGKVRGNSEDHFLVARLSKSIQSAGYASEILLASGEIVSVESLELKMAPA